MIQSFADGATEDLWNGTNSARARRFTAIEQVAMRKLVLLHSATKLGDLAAVPGNWLEALKGDLDGYHSIRVNKQWRIVFEWKDDGPHEVRISDYD